MSSMVFVYIQHFVERHLYEFWISNDFYYNKLDIHLFREDPNFLHQRRNKRSIFI